MILLYGEPRLRESMNSWIIAGEKEYKSTFRFDSWRIPSPNETAG
jgi:hypothetical protein